MFDISGGEFLVLSCVGIAFIGRNDLPRASRALGDRIGRIVGLLQGARIRGEQYAAKSQNKELQSGLRELRAGLRELDAVKAELAIAASTNVRGFSMTASPSPVRSTVIEGSNTNRMQHDKNVNLNVSVGCTDTVKPIVSGADYLRAAASTGTVDDQSISVHHKLAPRSQSVAAIAEEEWVKQGIGFKSRAEQVSWGSDSPNVGGSALLSEVISESLIHDQYDRVTREKDEMLRSKISDLASRKQVTPRSNKS